MRKITDFIIRKFFSYLLTLFILVTSIFFLLRLTPGDPVSKYISPELSNDLAEKVRNSFHLNDSVILQYWAFLKNMISGNFGVSYEYHQPVFTVIGEFLPFTFAFALISFSIQFFTGIGLAYYTVKRHNKLLEKIADFAALTVYSVPAFLIGIFLIYIFSLLLNIFPSADFYSAGYAEKNLLGKINEIVSHSILPLLTLSIPGIVVFYKYAKENLKSVLDKSFVKYLQSNGVNEKEIYRRHIFPNIMPQLISLSAVELSMLLGGALVTEVLFNLPGLGRMTVTAILQRDYPLVVTATFLSGVFVIICSFTGEILRGIIDKRFIMGTIS
jgi:peptide/nickel transport system permease protein